MAKLKEILGSNIQVLDDDPVAYEGSWASAPSMNVARNGMTGFGATNTAAVGVGGYNGSAYVSSTENFNGTSWTEVNEMNAVKAYMASAGTYTAGLVAAGHPGSGATDATETWNGTNWTEVNETNAPHSELRGCGTQTAAILAGGRTDPYPTLTNLCEVWDGTNWTEVNELNIAGVGIQLAGTSTLAIANSGGNPSPTARQTATELWNGSSWTNSTASNSSHREGAAAGIQTDALMGGGGPPATSNTEIWNGTSWTEVNNMATARNQMGSTVGQQTNSQSSLAFAGETPPGARQSATEEWSFPPSTSTARIEGQLYIKGGILKGFERAGGIPSTSWASGGSLNAGRYRLSASNTGGTVSASIIFGGYAPSSPPPNNYYANTESYDGTSFTEVNDLNTARSSASGFGSSTSAIMAAGNQSPKAQTELWNGTSWTEVNDTNTGRSQLAGGGISGTAGLIFGGSLPGYSMQSKTETWDGTSWTETGDLNLARDELAGSGVQTAAFAVAGKVKESGGPPTWYESNTHEQWDGSSWTETTEINTAVSAASAAGHTSSGLKIGGTAGLSPSGQTKTEFWNGSSWTELNDLSTQRQYLAQGSGTGVSNIVAGGYNGSTYGITNNEEWESDNTLSTVTVS